MKRPAAVLMIQGTSSNVGKSMMVTGLCRWFSNKGYKVAPFKAQNMALNSSVTPSGEEIGCAQFFQAEAARAVPSSAMNPILLKPEGESISQVVLRGQSIGTYSFRTYHGMKPELRIKIVEALDELRKSYDIVIIEGAGSPAEINLKANDLVNMFVAKACDAPVLLVGDIDRGGVFAAFVGTMELLEPDERERVAGFIINKFRGDPKLLSSGLEMLEAKTARRVFGLVPYLKDHGLPDEDSLGLERRPQRLRSGFEGVTIAILRYPRMSNYDEFHSLEREAGTELAYIEDPADIEAADLLILPGSKQTISDLAWLFSGGREEALRRRLAAGKPIMAICGGYQMLGAKLFDLEGAESPAGSTVSGLGFLDHETHFFGKKITRQVQVTWLHDPWQLGIQVPLTGYEIHVGRISGAALPPIFEVLGGETTSEGQAMSTAPLLGTMVHGLFENTVFRLALLNKLRGLKNLPLLTATEVMGRGESYDKLAAHIEANCDMQAILNLLHRKV